MRVFRSLADIRAARPRHSVLTLGVFDGVHRGHRSVVEELLAARKRNDIDGCYLITFDPHPVVVTHARMRPPMLTTIDERIDLLSAYDLDGISVLHFDEALANIDYRTFLERYMRQPFDMKLLILGYDCYFGKNREGSPERVLAESKNADYDVRVIEPLRNQEQIISSTKIRNALMDGDLAGANDLLGHPYLISGTVVHGHGKGVELGFPTANLAIEDPHKLWPPRGVYAVRARHAGRTLGGMMNIGRAPTVKDLDANAREVEIHVFDFDEDLYGERLSVECHRYLRDEQKFPSVDALVEQLHQDKEAALASLPREA